jgi:hypothetical protein
MLVEACTVTADILSSKILANLEENKLIEYRMKEILVTSQKLQQFIDDNTLFTSDDL